MTVVDVYSKPDCHLCDVMKAALRRAQDAHTFEIREHTIAEGTEEYAAFKERIPVVFLDGAFLFQYKFDAAAFAAAMRERG